MTEQQHTPGPWRNDNGIIRANRGCVAGMIYEQDDRGNDIEGCIGYQESRNNAYLIAAAPEQKTALLELLCHCNPIYRKLFSYEPTTVTLKEAEALAETALKKSEGGSHG